MRVRAEVSRGWLEAMGAPAQISDAVCGDVTDRLETMPSALRTAFRMIDAGLSTLPSPLRRRAHAVPGIGEYVRVVESLTAVSYFDAVSRSPLVPAPRSHEIHRIPVEPLA